MIESAEALERSAPFVAIIGYLVFVLYYGMSVWFTALFRNMYNVGQISEGELPLITVTHYHR